MQRDSAFGKLKHDPATGTLEWLPLLPGGLLPDAQAEKVETKEGVTEFDLGNRRYRYSRLGLERIVL